MKTMVQDALAAKDVRLALDYHFKRGGYINSLNVAFSPTLAELASMSGVKVHRTLISHRLKLTLRRGQDLDTILGVMKMFLATQLGSEHIA